MSWSTNAIGRAAGVAAAIVEQAGKQKCVEPEETIKTTVIEALSLALGSFPATYAVRVTASGSQYAPDVSKPDEKTNTLRVELDPIFGFVE